MNNTATNTATCPTVRKQIGKTTYIVRVHFSETAKETMEDKIKRLLREEVRDITMYDELSLDTVGDKKTALFLIMSDTDPTFNFLISMIYTQLFNLLCEKADDVYGGRLPADQSFLSPVPDSALSA